MPLRITVLQSIFEFYDRDHSGDLDQEEMLTSPAWILSLQFENLKNKDGLHSSFLFENLPTYKKSQIFENAYDVLFWKKEFKHLARHHLDEAVAILLQMKDLGFSIPTLDQLPLGLKASLYLGALTPNLKNVILEKIRKRDPNYFQSIMSIQPEMLSQYQRAKKCIDLFFTNKNEAVAFWRQQIDQESLLYYVKCELPQHYVREFYNLIRFNGIVQKPDVQFPHLASSLPHATEGHYEFKPQDVSLEQSVFISQNEYCVLKAGSKMYLQTAGVETCCVVILWDEKNKIGAMAHFDGSFDIEDSWDQILGDMVFEGAEREHISAQLLGAQSRSDEWTWPHRTVVLLRNYMQEQSIPLWREDVLGVFDARKSGVTFNVKTGEVFFHDEIQNKNSPYSDPQFGRMLRVKP